MFCAAAEQLAENSTISAGFAEIMNVHSNFLMVFNWSVLICSTKTCVIPQRWAGETICEWGCSP